MKPRKRFQEPPLPVGAAQILEWRLAARAEAQDHAALLASRGHRVDAGYVDRVTYALLADLIAQYRDGEKMDVRTETRWFAKLTRRAPSPRYRRTTPFDASRG